MGSHEPQRSASSQIAVGCSCIVLGLGLVGIAFLATSSTAPGRVAGEFADLAPLLYGVAAVLTSAGILAVAFGVKARRKPASLQSPPPPRIR